MLSVSSRVFLVIVVLLTVSAAHGQNTKVVVVPLFGDDAASGANGVDGTATDAVDAICIALGSSVGCDLMAVVAGIKTIYSIGDDGPAGGVVFYTTDGGLHGLEAAPVDIGFGETWGCSGVEIGGTSTEIGSGAANTNAIVIGCADVAFAAKSAQSYELNGYTDWFLPSKDELNQLQIEKVVVGGFTNDTEYWSSSEFGDNYVWYQVFGNGNQGNFFKSSTFKIRAVRAF